LTRHLGLLLGEFGWIGDVEVCCTLWGVVIAKYEDDRSPPKVEVLGLGQILAGGRGRSLIGPEQKLPNPAALFGGCGQNYVDAWDSIGKTGAN
jgi:hypothetical protein